MLGPAVEAVTAQAARRAGDADAARGETTAPAALARRGRGQRRLADRAGGGLRARAREPALELGLRQDDDLAPHARVPGAAELGAQDVVPAQARRREPDRGVAPGHGVLLQAEGGNEPAVDHVARREHQPHRTSERDVERARRGRAVGVRELPHPLLAGYVDLHRARRRQARVDVLAVADHPEHQERDQQHAREDALEPERRADLGRDGVGRERRPAVVAPREPSARPERDGGDHPQERELEKLEGVDAGRHRRRLLRHHQEAVEEVAGGAEDVRERARRRPHREPRESAGHHRRLRARARRRAVAITTPKPTRMSAPPIWKAATTAPPWRRNDGV